MLNPSLVVLRPSASLRVNFAKNPGPSAEGWNQATKEILPRPPLQNSSG